VSFSRLWFFLAVALPALAALIAPMSSVDLTYHLRAGSEILATGRVPTVDTWTFTAAGQPWIDQQWGAQAVFALTERIGGWTLIVLLRAALTGLVFACLYLIGRRHGLDARTSGLLSLVAFLVASPAMAMRPQLLGMACFALVLLLVADRRAHPGRLWLALIVIAAWANVHGSFFLGPAVLGLAWLEDVHDRVPRPHHALKVAIAGAAAACLTPFGPFVWTYAVGLSTNPEVTARIAEWQPTSLRAVPGILFFGSVLAVVLLIARRGRQVSWPTLATLTFFALIGTYAERGVAWWPPAAAAAIAGGHLLPSRPEPASAPSSIRRLNMVLAGVLTLAAVAALPVWRPVDPGTRVPAGLLTDAPPGLTAELRDLGESGDHVFHPQRWGSWFEYAIPDRLTAIDSRIEFFPPEVWRDYEGVAAGIDGWEARLDDWDVATVIVEVRDTAFAARLVEAGWRETHRDADGSLFRREAS
jgi:hypothetical protein